ncbi:MAG TPA: hypothetical protein VFG54_04500 [Prolixibacteraceae bacterium]|nr:hypothetical protein [Prolixibacteraceae bacterium]
MKTKTRTFIGIVALGIIGFTTINATAGNREMKAYNVIEAEESLSIESWMLKNDLFTVPAESKTDTAEAEKALIIESWMTDENFFTEAESYTAEGTDEEIEKYAAKQVALENERNK